MITTVDINYRVSQYRKTLLIQGIDMNTEKWYW